MENGIAQFLMNIKIAAQIMRQHRLSIKDALTPLIRHFYASNPKSRLCVYYS